MSGAEGRARQVLTEAPTDLIVDRLAAELARTYGVARTELYQVDYRLAELLPLDDGPSVTGPGHPAWRAFDHQEPVIADGVGWFPVGMRGERRGVLKVSPVPADPHARRELDTIATVLGHELSAVTATTDIYRTPGAAGGSRWPPRCSGSCCPGAAGSGRRSAWPGSWSRRTRCAGTASTGPTTVTGSGWRC
ncbi:hypothetical protein [Micromonospora aurantiaca]|uniref:hypothetical protein n=1 Tax=Micromonospora aurantiaca (nom. illeg.) TaxID=47850 RepID=UPI001F086C7D|nr:hypothetical protein [Micromonospora aurantiaca]